MAVGRDADLPDLEDDFYLGEWLLEIGPLRANGAGHVPVDYAELRAWSGLTGYIPTPFEAVALIEAAREYSRTATESSGKITPAPYSTGAVDRDAVAEQIKAGFRSMMTGNRK